MGGYRTTWHFLHAILTILTGGFWIVVWLCCWASNNQYNARLDRQRFLDSLDEQRRRR